METEHGSLSALEEEVTIVELARFLLKLNNSLFGVDVH
ncbi:hypothetical protein PI125_g3956 [Phytophthora idaei]|nr:hypothetical protein PI125_g3956 [Phytophthora idaei]KAG3152653.1 hypothetical protein PI126_g10435 [Phytophthora idaei]